MPISKQAKKKQRHDVRARARLLKVRANVRSVVKSVRNKPTAKNLTDAFKNIDKAVKVNVVHKNKAARLKSKLSKLLKR